MGVPWIVERRGDHVLVATGGPGSPEPNEWPGALIDAARRLGPGIATVAKRVSTAGTIVAMGERCVHPKGLHSVGHGLPAAAHRFPEEVDGSMDGLAAFPAATVDGLDEPRGAFGLLRWCLEARLRGARIVAVPDVAWVSGGEADPIQRGDLEDFVERFGFHPFAPDIDAIAARTELDRLRWDVRHFGRGQPFDKYAQRGAFHWQAFRDNDSFRKRAEFLVKLAHQVAATGSGPLLDIGCGDGLYAQLLAETGLPVLGIDEDLIGIDEARRMVAERSPQAAFRHGSVYALGERDGSARGAILLDVVEHLHNPARALRELARVIATQGSLILSTPEWQFGHMSDPVYHAHEFTSEELQRLVAAEGLFTVERTARIGGVYRDIVVVARRTAAPPATR